MRHAPEHGIPDGRRDIRNFSIIEDPAIDIGNYELDLENFALAFDSLEDPRSDLNRLHPLLSVLAIAVMAILAGAGGPTAIARWANHKADWLTKLLPLPNGIPRKDFFRRVLMSLDPATFQACFVAWIEKFLAAHEAESDRKTLLNIDGKTLRRSHDKTKDLGVLHSVSMWAGEYGLTLAQVACAEFPVPEDLVGRSVWKGRRRGESRWSTIMVSKPPSRTKPHEIGELAPFCDLGRIVGW